MADAYPESTFVGIDLSERQIGEGLESVQALGLKNIALRRLGILDVGSDLGQFDYIICHGVFSWVPAEVRDKILSICRDNISPNGVAYVSYNTYPGWRMREIIRDALRYHTKPFSDPATRIRQAKAILDFLSESIPTAERAYGMIFKSEIDLLRGCPDSYLFHEHLEDVNDPIYFEQFVEQAKTKGLQYLSEARVATTTFGRVMPAHIRSTINLIAADLIAMEQYFDFLSNRPFRKTLLCRQEIAIKRSLSWEAVRGLHVATNLRPKNAEPKIAEDSPETFTSAAGDTVSSSNPIIKAAFWLLGRIWPQSMRFEALVKAASECLPAALPPSLKDSQAVGEMLLQSFLSGVVHFSLSPSTCIATVSERPQASGISRFQAGRGMSITNRKHITIDSLNDVDRHVLRHLDGTRDRCALLATLLDAYQRGLLVRNSDGELVSDRARLESRLNQALDESLRCLAGKAFLIA